MSNVIDIKERWEDPSGEFSLSELGVPACFQCSKCSLGCPIREEMDYLPHQIIRLLHLGLIDEVYQSKTLWLCLSCETCYARCPQEVDFPTLMDEVRQLSERLSIKPSIPEISIFDKIFLFTVRRFGRLFELGFMALYKVLSLNIFKDISRLPKMLVKGKLSLLPHSSNDKKELREVFKRFGSEK